MAIFGNKKDEKKAKAAPKKASKEVKVVAAEPKKKTAKAAGEVVAVRDVLVRPRITEKAANMTVGHVYTFDVRVDATKREIADAVKKIYKVTPIKVTVVNMQAKRVRLRTRRGFGKTTAGRKAYVTLKKGEEITFS